MLTDRQRTQPWGRYRHPAVACLLVLLAALTASSTAASASTLANQRAQAARTMEQLDLLQTRRDQALADERAANARLASSRALVAASRVQIAATLRSLTVTQDVLAETIVSSYKGGDSDAISYVLASGSFSDLLARVDVLHRVASGDEDLMRQIHQTQIALAAQLSQRRSAAAAALEARAAASAARAKLDHAIATRSAVLARVNSSIRTLLAAEVKRRKALGGTGSGSGVGSAGGGSGGGSGGNPSVFYGECTWYGPGFAGHPTASGEPFDPEALTAASPWLPFGTQLMVTDLQTGLSVQVRVNDRGPFGRGVLDLSAHAARVVHLSGWQRVRITILSSGPHAGLVMP
ncbi:MAG: rare lipoprotein [Gaiellales bacterium]|jgi:rare lipoprotein A (peptidoglycan hydrolase)|nr:rare lipoprotein [Gaiellales bacterium]